MSSSNNNNNNNNNNNTPRVPSIVIPDSPLSRTSVSFESPTVLSPVSSLPRTPVLTSSNSPLNIPRTRLRVSRQAMERLQGGPPLRANANDYVPENGIAFHVHNIFHEMFGNKNEEVKEKTKQLITKLINYNKTIVIEEKPISSILNESFSPFIEDNLKDEKEKKSLLDKLKQITDKLTQYSVNNLKEDEDKLLQVAIKYVVLQDKEFAINYIIFYLKDVTEAYEGENTMSCVGGIHERIILMLISQMGLYIVSGDDKNKIKEYEDILSVFILPKDDTNKILATLNEEMGIAVDKKDKLEEQKFSSDETDLLLINDHSKKDSDERKQSFIKQVNRIKAKLQISGQISESNMNDMYETFNLSFGGKKKKTRKNNKKYKINKSKKIKHKFIRKTRKRNVKKVQMKKHTQSVKIQKSNLKKNEFKNLFNYLLEVQRQRRIEKEKKKKV